MTSLVQNQCGYVKAGLQNFCEKSKNWGGRTATAIKNSFSYCIKQISTCARSCIKAVSISCSKGKKWAKAHPGWTALIGLALIIIFNRVSN